MQNKVIRLKGVRQNNLKNFDLEIPTGKLTVITGPSGSGKSSLAFQTLYAEGQRRYVETFSPYVRQFFDRMDKPAVDKIEGIPPAIAIEQKNAIRTSRSTVGTLTELNDYLKLLFSRLAKGYDPVTGEEIRPDNADTIVGWLQKHHLGEPVSIVFPIEAPPEERSLAEFFEFLNQQGYIRILVNQVVYRTDEPPSELPFTPSEARYFVIQDRIKVSVDSKARQVEAFERALVLGRGRCDVVDRENKTLRTFSDQWYNPNTGTILTSPTSGLFSFNSPIGACPKCRGFGRVVGVDLRKAIPDPSLSINAGCVKPFQGDRGDESQTDLLRFATEQGIDLDVPFQDLTPDEQEWVLYGEAGPVCQSTEDELSISEQLWLEGKWYGVQGFFDWLESKSYKMHVRVFLARYRSYTTCPACRGKRLKPAALCYRIGEYTLPALWSLSVKRLSPFFEALEIPSSETTLKHVYDQILSRIHYLQRVGLGYLTLDRAARTLSGGEIARVNLTTCLGASLTGTLFVLDEPTVGLHPRDVSNLTEVMHDLRDKGNTLVVVEHEEAVMRQADELIDIGPGAGLYGGEILYQGVLPAPVRVSTERPTTLDYLDGTHTIAVPFERRHPMHFIELQGLRENNISNLSVRFPLGVLACVTGVSGSGKSTLVEKGLYQNLLQHFAPEKVEEASLLDSLNGWEEHLSGVVFINQSPLAKTPRSTPAVYLGAFNEVRQLFALTEEATNREVNTGYFSFNSGAGRCERCMGNGFERVEMQFLSDLYLTCPECDGRRYQKEVLEILYRGKSVADILDLTTAEALAFYEDELETFSKPIQKRHKIILKILSSLAEVGLGYLRLGQPLNTLSGGESQRLKIASILLETSKGKTVIVPPKLANSHDTPRAMQEKLESLQRERAASRSKKKSQKGKLLILDEPTTGLHFGDIEVLLQVFDRLVEAGHSLLVVEHNLEVIKSADYLIDLGPEAGENGGEIVGEGTPEAVAKLDTLTGHFLAQALHPSYPVAEALVAEESALYEVKPQNTLSIRGARHHNLKDLDLDLPLNSFNVITGLSGSGKSTIAFDLIFAEGQRRFLDSMSPYARQFAEQLEKPEVDVISGLPPTVAIEQRVSRGGVKSTVATVTEIYHFLRLLFAKLGVQHCPVSGDPVVSQTEAAILEKVKTALEAGDVRVLAPVVRGKKGYHKDIAVRAERLGYEELLIDRQLVAVADFTPLERYVEHDIDIVVGRLRASSSRKAKGMVREALQLSNGFIRLLDHRRCFLLYSTERVSATTGESFEAPDPADFSFNSPRGWCPECRGYGSLTTKKLRLDKFDSALEAELAEEKSRKEEDEESIPCPTCNGSRLKRASNFIYLLQPAAPPLSLPALTAMTVQEAKSAIQVLEFKGRARDISRDVIPEVVQRLQFLDQVGLGYLSLDRSSNTLSGGESQRIRLAAQLGSNLQGVLYVLDEPTIGLHPRDNKDLLDTLQKLQKKGNSLLIVEHDEETMARANRIIDLGPGAGRLGGEVMAQGSLKQLMRAKSSVTGHALKHPMEHPSRDSRRPLDSDSLPTSEWLTLKGCHQNNLQNIDVTLPKGRLTVVTGVSGSGKSSFMRGTLQPVANLLHKLKNDQKLTKAQLSNLAPYCTSAHGFSGFKYIFEVDQSPIGKTSRSCPATYVKLFDQIRILYAQLAEAQIRGFTLSRFSFNNKDGQCPECKGNGSVKLEMDFLPSTRVPCETCRGDRYNPATLSVRYKGKSISDVLRMSIEEAAAFFSTHQKLSRTLNLLRDTGLGYLQIGQPSPTLSGGEAQRLKLVTELTKGRASLYRPAQPNLYLIEEPSIGLHLNDITKLIDVLHRLTDEGHTVVVVEHHPTLMAEADYILDFGPEAGPNGGQICASGPPEEIAQSPHSATAPFIAACLSGRA